MNFGKNSLKIGLITPVLVLVLLVMGVILAESAQSSAGKLILLATIWGALLAHIVGVVWGIRALMRPYDDTLLSALGAGINFIQLGIGFWLLRDLLKSVNGFG